MLTKLIDGRGVITTIYNATGQEIRVIDGSTYVPSTGQYVGGKLAAVIPPSGVVLSCEKYNHLIDYPTRGVEIIFHDVEECDKIPEEARHVRYIIVTRDYEEAFFRYYGAIRDYYRDYNDYKHLDEYEGYKDGKSPLPRFLVVADHVVESVDNPIPIGYRGLLYIDRPVQNWR